MSSLSRTAAAAVRSAARSAPLGRVLGTPVPSLTSLSAARSSRILLRRSAGLETLMPLHSAVAAARLRSCIAVDDSYWTSLSQGNAAKALGVVATILFDLSPVLDGTPLPEAEQ